MPTNSSKKTLDNDCYINFIKEIANLDINNMTLKDAFDEMYKQRGLHHA